MAADDMTDDSKQWHVAVKTFWVVVGGSLCLLFGMGIVIRLTPPYTHLHDFVQEWTSAKNYYADEPIYLDLHKSFPIHLGEGWRVGHIDVNAHPPTSVLVVLPFGLLDYEKAYLVWNLLSLAMLGISIWLIMRRKGLDFSPWMLLPIATLLITSNSLAQQINQGQLNLLLLLLITGAWTADRNRRPILAGTLIGIAAGIKLFPAFLFLYFLVRRQWSALAGGALATVAVCGLSVLVFGVDAHVDYVKNVMPQVAQFRDYWANASIAGYWAKLFEPLSGHVVPVATAPGLAKVGTIACWLLAIAASAWKTWRADSRTERDWAFGVTIIAMLLVSPITWDHYFLLLVLPVAVMWKYMATNVFVRLVFLVFIVILVFVNPKWLWDAAIPGDGELPWDQTGVASVAQPIHTLTVLSYQFYALLALFLLSLLLKARDSENETEFEIEQSNRLANEV